MKAPETVEPDLLRKWRELTVTQAALRRLAVLIAENASPEQVFAAVTTEIRRRFGLATARMLRFEADGTTTLMANDGTLGPHVRVGKRWTGFPAAGLTATVRRTGGPARIDDYRDVPGGEPYVSEGLVGAVAVPIHVGGRLWGMIAIGSTCGPLPGDVEEQLVDFTGLIVTAIATAQSRADIAESRARIITASDEARQRIERDLHDGAQQQLVSLAMRLSTMSESPTVAASARTQLRDAVTVLRSVIDDLREMARGIHPAILSEAGLGPALRTLARRSALPVRLRVHVPTRLSPSVEVGAYYVVSETLTNASKHSQANQVEVEVVLEAEVLRVIVSDDGIGGADGHRGSGLVGLRDRVEALGGRLSIHSPTEHGTVIQCEMPARGVRHPRAHVVDPSART
jgi:signal transduction histidine kinase